MIATDRTTQTGRYSVGGVLMDRPFKIRRLGHFGFNLVDVQAGVEFYRDRLGFCISDVIDLAGRTADASGLEGLGDTRAFFMRYGTDHHAMVFFPKRVLEFQRPENRATPHVTVNQITWQVGGLAEVVRATPWLKSRQVRLRREGRDTPGSNWETYLYDTEGHVNELYYGIEQIGWDGFSKPRAMYRRFDQAPPLPQISEAEEVDRALAAGIDLTSGYRHREVAERVFDVDGVLLARPFRVIRLGPVRLFVADVTSAIDFYRDILGLALTEEVTWHGHRCGFLRVNTEHHSVALYPLELRAELGLSEHTTCLSFGLHVGSYSQLRAARSFLTERGIRLRTLPAELSPGIDASFLALDPDGHALQLYYYMEQIGWDGRPRPDSERVHLPEDPDQWPDLVEAYGDTYAGETLLGPWG